MKTSSLSLLAGALLAGSATAQQLPDIIVCDPINDALFRWDDADGDGLFSGNDEVSLMMDLALLNQPTGAFNPDAAVITTENGNAVIYFVSDFPDGIYRAEDTNLNGNIELSEVALWFDAAAGPGTIDPAGICITADGAVWVSSAVETARGIWRLEDTSGDGVASGAGEVQQLLDSSVPWTVETDGAPTAILSDDVWRMTPDGNGVVCYVGFSSSCATESSESYFRFEDTNSDGDVLDAGESRLWLSYTTKNPALPQQADWAAGTLRNFENANPSTSTNPDCTGFNSWGRLNYITSQDEGGVTTFYVACDSSSTSPFALNNDVSPLGLNGLVYRCRDNNADGDVQDLGEVNLFLDASTTSAFYSGNNAFDKIVGIGTADDGWVYLADLVNGQRFCRAQDLNGDGDANDMSVPLPGGGFADELQVDLWDFGTWGPNPPFIPDDMGVILGPFIENIAVAPAGIWPAHTPAFVIDPTTQACSQYGLLPQIGGQGTARVGEDGFTCFVNNFPGGQVALFFIGASKDFWLGIPLPFDLSTVGFGSGCFLYQSLDLGFGLIGTGTGADDGYAEFNFAFPNNPAFSGIDLQLQWMIGNVTTTFPTTAFTELGTVTVE